MSDNEALARRFMALFDGYEHAHGQYILKRGSSDSGKVVGQPFTVPEPWTLSSVLEHLQGNTGAGGIPLLEDNTVRWAAMDFDVYGIDHAALARQVEALKLPLIVCRTKSGGAHCYIFFAIPQPATDVREQLAAWAAVLGHGGCEIFPKQDSRADRGDVGNWINLPYHGAFKGSTLRPAYGPDGRDLYLEEFLDRAENMRLTELPQVVISADRDPGGLLADGPPCLQHILNRGGFGEGERNEGLFNVAVYLRKRYGDTWGSHLLKYNMEMCDPPLSASEVVALEKAVNRKDYGYRCQQAPIKPFCQRRTCLARAYGVGQGADEAGAEITGLTKYDSGSPATVRWGMTIGGGRIIVDTATLYDPSAFNRACMAVINRIPVSMPPARWRKNLDELLQKADVVHLPEDASPIGQTWLWVVQFLTQKAHARTFDEILTGRPYHEDGKVYFRSQDLFQYLRANRVAFGDETDVYHLLREKGVDKKYHKLRQAGRSTAGAQVWFLPLPEGAEPPKPANEEITKEAF